MDMINFMDSFIVEPESTINESSISGTGCYASVFDSDMPNLVVKRIQKHAFKNLFNDGWLIWAIYCMNVAQKKGVTPNSFLPQIYGLVINYDKKVVYAVIEKLKDTYMMDNDKDHHEKPYKTGELTQFMKNNSQFFKAYKEIHVAFKKIIKLLKVNETKNMFFDGHSGNWMWRETENGMHIVLTDPFIIFHSTCADEQLLMDVNLQIIEMAKRNPNIQIIGQPEFKEK